jgi:hypothetical protein
MPLFWPPPAPARSATTPAPPAPLSRPLTRQRVLRLRPPPTGSCPPAPSTSASSAGVRPAAAAPTASSAVEQHANDTPVDRQSRPSSSHRDDRHTGSSVVELRLWDASPPAALLVVVAPRTGFDRARGHYCGATSTRVVAQLTCAPPRPAAEATPQFAPAAVPPASAPAAKRPVRSRPPRRALFCLLRPCLARPHHFLSVPCDLDLVVAVLFLTRHCCPASGGAKDSRNTRQSRKGRKKIVELMAGPVSTGTSAHRLSPALAATTSLSSLLFPTWFLVEGLTAPLRVP